MTHTLRTYGRRQLGWCFGLLLIGLLGPWNSFLGAQIIEIDRGPYLQMATHNSMTVRWRTTDASQSWLWYGTAPGQWTDSIHVSQLGADHSITIQGLQPYTRYYYAIGTEAGHLHPVGPDFGFRTNPLPGADVPLRFWAAGDLGTGDQNQVEVMNAILGHSGQTPPDFWLILGDIVYDNGEDEKYNAQFFDPYKPHIRNTPVWPLPGNHDYNGLDRVTQEGSFFNNFTLPAQAEAGGTASGVEMFYSFDYGPVHLICLNSEHPGYLLQRENEMTAWLREDLQNNTRPWVIAAWHQPPYSRGSHNSDDFWELLMARTREYLVPILEEFGVDLILNGHSHNYERSYLMQGHTGSSSSYDPAVHRLDAGSGSLAAGTPYRKAPSGRGAVFVVAGSGGKLSNRGTQDHPAHFYANKDLRGGIVIDVRGDTLHGQWVAQDGVVYDEFAIIHDETLSRNSIVPSPWHHLAVAPNPSAGSATLHLHGPGISQATDISIWSLTGQQLRQHTASPADLADGRYALDTLLAGLPAGLYFVRVQAGDATRSVPLRLE